MIAMDGGGVAEVRALDSAAHCVQLRFGESRPYEGGLGRELKSLRTRRRRARAVSPGPPRLVDDQCIVGTISDNGRHRIVDLSEQHGNPSAVTRPTTGQIRGNDLARARVDDDVQFPPAHARLIAELRPQTNCNLFAVESI